MNKHTSVKLKHLFFLTGVAAILGAIAGGVTILFVKSLELLQTILWQTIPNALFGTTTSLYIVITTLIGGLLVGLCVHYFGDYPKSLEENLQTFRKTKRFDYKHMPSTIASSYASLSFGASLGPEAALISIIGGLGTWIATILKRFTNLGEMAFVSVGAAVATLFGSPLGGAALAHIEAPKKQQTKLWLYLPALVAGGVSFLLFKTFANGGYFDIQFLHYTFSWTDLLPLLGISLLCVIVAFIFFYTGKVAVYVAEKLKITDIFLAVLGGLGLGITALFTSFALFSGHEGIQEIITDIDTFTGVALIAIALLKLMVTNWLLATGWKGGRFFPVMFAGAAFGLGIAMLVNIDPMLGLGVGLSATLAAVLQKPVAAVLLALFFFPTSMYVIVVLSGLLAGSISKKVYPQ